MKRVINILFLLLFCATAYSQTECTIEQKSEEFEIYFKLDKCVVDPTYRDNDEQLDNLEALMTRLQQDPQLTIESIEVDSYASPEGGYHYNEKLTDRRTNSVCQYLSDKLSVSDSLIERSHSGIDWDGLHEMVENSDMPYRNEVLHILENVPEEKWARVNPNDRWLSLVDSRIKHLMDLRFGRPYRYMAKNFFPLLRTGSIVTVYFKKTVNPIMDEDVEMPRSAIKTTSLANLATVTTAATAAALPYESHIKFALKTNLLFDAVTALNVEAEVPIGDRWSVAGEWIFPWWVTKDNGYALEVLSGQLEGRYWLGDRTTKPQLTGWFAGFYAGGGLYDLQWANNGYQGEFYIASGVSAGYAHTINKSGSLRMEYSLGLGYLSTQYRYYEGRQDNQFLVWQHNGKYSWIGPTRAKVSLVWFIDWKRGGKR